MSSQSQVGRRGCARRTGLLAVSVAMIATTLYIGPPRVLANVTPSEPPGLYIETGQSPGVGRIVAFRAPPAAFPYADARLSYLHRIPLLKAIAAGPGDHVCSLSGRLAINGADRGPIARLDGAGRVLPRWRSCRRLAHGEFFLFSDRVPNSFDSRYYGPVNARAVLGVYAPVLMVPAPR